MFTMRPRRPPISGAARRAHSHAPRALMSRVQSRNIVGNGRGRPRCLPSVGLPHGGQTPGSAPTDRIPNTSLDPALGSLNSATVFANTKALLGRYPFLAGTSRHKSRAILAG